MGEIVYIQDDRVVTDSLTVAEVFGKKHDNVLRDIRNQIKKLDEAKEDFFASVNFEECDYINDSATGINKNRKYKKYLLTENAFTMVTMAYTTVEAMKFKVRYINEFNRMRNLIGQKNSRIPSTFAEALRLAADQQEQIEEMKPKVESFEMFIDGTNYQTMNEVAKALGYGRNKLFAFLRDQKILMKDNIPYQRFVDSGYFVVKETHIKNTGENKPQTFVTSKGVDYISRLLKKQSLVLLK